MTFKEELEQLLKKELEVLAKLKTLSFEKTDLIINNRIQKLEEATMDEETLINEISFLEEEREKLLDNWGVGKDTSISDVIEKIPEEKEDLVELKDKLSHELEELYLRNALNNDLIRDSLEWIDFNMNLITNSSQTPTTYGKGNKGLGGNSIFDRKV
ncbi:flagellar protein FlgN [Tissierella sp. MSJ-40]|uniref:Flagellar protein FlgN n=1 Tax=Tissierella simiarum TaxID=2841534 RepID=A0ABS6E197_9FIRM|nr:flagellar protein FlgN [Tissierella simiarum]MBU5436679.1 flagellar protein FlgN [Tissierella simiarum]